MTAKFPLGEIVATPGALAALEASGQTPDFFLDRHVSGNWGDVDDQDADENDESVRHGWRILSAYRTLKGVPVWVITEADRTVTTLLLPSEY